MATPSILVVDDNEDAAALLAEAVELLGFVARVANDGARALELAATSEPPAAALVDIGLPGMDGLELARRLRELPGWRAVRLIAISGYGRPSDRSSSREAGFDLHIVKPLGLAGIKKALTPLS